MSCCQQALICHFMKNFKQNFNKSTPLILIFVHWNVSRITSGNMWYGVYTHFGPQKSILVKPFLVMLWHPWVQIVVPSLMIQDEKKGSFVTLTYGALPVELYQVAFFHQSVRQGYLRSIPSQQFSPVQNVLLCKILQTRLVIQYRKRGEGGVGGDILKFQSKLFTLKAKWFYQSTIRKLKFGLKIQEEIESDWQDKENLI